MTSCSSVTFQSHDDAALVVEAVRAHARTVRSASQAAYGALSNVTFRDPWAARLVEVGRVVLAVEADDLDSLANEIEHQAGL